MSTKSNNLELVKARQQRLRSAGLCITCGKTPAKGPGATKNNCPLCAGRARKYYRDRYRKAHNISLSKPVASGRPLLNPNKE